MSSFQQYTVSTALSASQTVANFNAVRGGNILPKAGASLAETNGAHNVGSSSYRWDAAYLSGIASSVTVTAPVTFSSQAIFNTSTTLSPSGLPSMLVAKYMVGFGVGPQSGSSTAEIIQFNTTTINTIQNATLTTNQISIPSGSYVFNVYSQFHNTTGFPIESSFYLFDATSSLTVFTCGGPQTADTATSYAYDMIVSGAFSVLTQSSIELRVAHASAVDSYFGPSPAYPAGSWNDGFNKNVYQQIVFFKVS